MDIIPQPGDGQNDGQKLTITPDGVEIYHAMKRGKQYVTFHYQKDKPVRLATALTHVGAVLDDLAQGGLLVRGPIVLHLSPQSIEHVTSGSSFTTSLKIEVRPRVEQEADNAAWVEGMRAHFARKREEAKA